MSVHHQIAIAADLAEVYAAIATPERLASWWTPHTAEQTPEGLVITHDPGPGHGVVRLRVTLAPMRRIEWECISSHPGDSPASAWTGTRLVWELSDEPSPAARFVVEPGKAATTVDFRHVGYPSESEFAGFNSLAWAMVLHSLKQVLEAS